MLPRDQLKPTLARIFPQVLAERILGFDDSPLDIVRECVNPWIDQATESKTECWSCRIDGNLHANVLILLTDSHRAWIWCWCDQQHLELFMALDDQHVTINLQTGRTCPESLCHSDIVKIKKYVGFA